MNAAAIAAAAGAVGAAGITGWITYAVTKRSVTSAEKTAEKQRTHERDQAREARDQQRLFDAYVAIQRHVSSWVQSVAWRIRLYETDPPTPQPDPDALSNESEAIAGLVASEHVDALVIEFNRLVRIFLVAVRRSEDARLAASEDPAMIDPAVHADMTEAGHAVILTGLQLNNQMRTELRRAPLPIPDVGSAPS